MSCGKIHYIVSNSNYTSLIHGRELHYLVFLLQKVEVNQTTSSRSCWHLNMDFIRRHSNFRKIRILFIFKYMMPSWVQSEKPQSVNLALIHYVVGKWVAPHKFGFFNEINIKSVTLKIEEAFGEVCPLTRSHQHVHSTLAKSIRSSHAQTSYGPKWKKPHSNWPSQVRDMGYTIPT